MKISRDGMGHLLAVTRPALLLAPKDFLTDIEDRLATAGVQAAVATRDSEPIYDWLMTRVALQGISDRAALTFAHRSGEVTWRAIADDFAMEPSCPKLGSYWAFAGCGYRKDRFSCGEPEHLPRCPLPLHPLRKGGLNIAAFSLWLFFRDCCGGDFVSWIDTRLAAANPGRTAPERATTLRNALLEPLCQIAGTGPKLWAMILADLLVGADPGRERWVTAGTSMVAIDSLVHNYLRRTGSLTRCGAEHAYGPACYGPDGCADMLATLAEAVDAREFNPSLPGFCPRYVQHALWHFCAEGGLALCNGRRIDDARRCTQPFCPAGPACDRLALRG